MPRSWAIEWIGEFFGTSSAEPCGLAWNAPTIVRLSPPAAANTGGALPTLPMSTAPPAMACSIGGPEVKSDQVTLNGSLLIRPAAVSRACEPEPAWSPMCRVTWETSVVLALAAEPVLPPDEAGVPPALAEEQPAASSASRASGASGAASRSGRRIPVVVIRLPPGRRPAR